MLGRSNSGPRTRREGTEASRPEDVCRVDEVSDLLHLSYSLPSSSKLKLIGSSSKLLQADWRLLQAPPSSSKLIGGPSKLIGGAWRGLESAWRSLEEPPISLEGLEGA